MMPAKAYVYETTPQIKNRILVALTKPEYRQLFHIAAGQCLMECCFLNSVP